jgi:hypothetical protein
LARGGGHREGARGKRRLGLDCDAEADPAERLRDVAVNKARPDEPVSVVER